MRPAIHFYLRVEKDRLLHDRSARIYMRVSMENVKQPRFSMGYSIPLRKEFQHLKEEEILSIPTEKVAGTGLTRYELYHWDNDAEKPTKGCGNMHEIIRPLEREKEKTKKVIDDHLMSYKTFQVILASRVLSLCGRGSSEKPDRP